MGDHLDVLNELLMSVFLLLTRAHLIRNWFVVFMDVRNSGRILFLIFASPEVPPCQTLVHGELCRGVAIGWKLAVFKQNRVAI